MPNYYKDPGDPNRNPIHVLRPNVPHELSLISDTFAKVAHALIEAQKLNDDAIVYGEEKDPASKTPQAGWGSVMLYDGFMMYLWAFCYCMYVYHTEMTIKRNNNNQQGKPDLEGIDLPKLRQAMALMKYAMSLLEQYSPWDESLPNPAVYPEELRETVEKVNAIYLKALNFVIGHEVAHLEKDHTLVETQDTIAPIDMEKQADARSIEYMQDGITKVNEATVQIGLMAALCSLLLAKNSLQTSGYPDADDRIGAFIERLKLTDDNDLWALVVLAYRLWDSHYNKGLFWPQKLQSQKEVYKHLRLQLKGQAKAEHFQIEIAGITLDVTKYKPEMHWQYQVNIEGVTVNFESNATGQVEGSVNSEYIEEDQLQEICDMLTNHQSEA